MKRIVLHLAAIVSVLLMNIGHAQAETVSPEAAKAKAIEFLSTGARKALALRGMKQAPALRGMKQAPAVKNVELAYTSVKDGKTCFYVYNNGENDGFVIIGGDDVAKEILAYVPEGHFDYDKAPDNLKWWLNKYENVDNLPSRIASNDNSSYHDIPDLITTKWDQCNPYNCVIQSQCGEDYSTGCTATALAQIMKFWNYPNSGKGSHTDSNFPSFSADFENTTYDWDNMLDSYFDGYNQEQAEAIGTLMYHVGVALDLIYDISGSARLTDIINGIEVSDGTDALVNFFNYDKNLTSICRATYTVQEWKNILYDELLAGRPIYYTGHVLSGKDYGGHAFVCHGYSAALDMFAFNWGWGGLADGYFTIAEEDHFLASESLKNFETVTIGIKPSGQPESSDVCYGERFISGGITYMVTSASHHTVSVASAESSLTDISIPEYVQYKGESYTVIRIEARPFFSDLGKIQLPNTLRSISSEAFYHCYNLEEITIPEGVEILGYYAFDWCSSLKSINLPPTLRQIWTGAFEGCSSLNNLVFPDNVNYLDQSIFYHCESLETVTLPKNLQTMQPLFTECYRLYDVVCPALIPPKYDDYIILIGRDDMKMAYNQENSILWVPAASIDAYKSSDIWNVFGDIRAIETRDDSQGSASFTVDGLIYKQRINGVEVVGYEKISDDLTIPSTVTYNETSFNVVSVGHKAFYYKNIKKLNIEEGIVEIKASAFDHCSMLEQISIPASVECIGKQAFAGSAIKELVIPFNSHLNLIDSGAFSSCENLETVSIGKCNQICCSFEFCDFLKRVYLGDVFWENNGFRNSTSIEEFIISDKVRIFDEYGPFSKLKKMVSFVNAPTQKDLPTYYERIREDFWFELHNNFPFSEYQSEGTLYVPEACIDTYKSSEAWQPWGSILPIVPLTNIALDKNCCNLQEKQQASMKVLASPTNATVQHVIWSSSDLMIASVNQDGIVTACKKGTTTIYARSMYYPDLIDSCIVTVTPSSHKIVYVLDGETYQTDSINAGDAIVLPEEPVKAGYVFIGWEGLPKDSIMPAHDVVVTGSFSINKYLLTYMVDGEVYQSDSIVYNASIVPLDAPEKEGYSFSGWSEIPATMPAHDVVVTGSFSINKYLLTYMVDGEVYQSDSIVYNASIVPLDAPEKEGYIFEEWIGLPDFMPAYDVTVSASFKIIDGIIGIEMNSCSQVFDLTGKFIGEMTDDELQFLKPGIYIVNNKKLIVQ